MRRVTSQGVGSGRPTLWDRSPCTLAEDAHLGQGGWKTGLEVHGSSQSTLKAKKRTFSFFQALSLIRVTQQFGAAEVGRAASRSPSAGSPQPSAKPGAGAGLVITVVDSQAGLRAPLKAPTRWPNPCAVKGPWHRSHRDRDGTLGLDPQPDVSVSAGTWRAGLEDRRRGRPYRYAPPAGRRDSLSQVRADLGLDSHRWIRRAPRARTTPDPRAR
ncbi:TPA: hypothetical protein BOS_3569 [Bos taurus]|nr:TPA: hypothetical protein BOS_3569 [Bos taurus]